MNRISSIEIADLRADVRTIHDTLTGYKQEAGGIVALLDEQIAALEENEPARGKPEKADYDDRLELIQDTRELAETIFLRLEHGDSAFREDHPVEDEDESL